MQLNHLNLFVPDVAQTCAFFQTHLGFQCEAMKGREALAVLKGEGGFTLVISRFRDGSPTAYPTDFHIGFLLESEHAVRETYERFTQAGVEIVYPLNARRGSLMFYCRAPGQVLIEISARLAPSPGAPSASA